METKKN
ncbi:lipid A biosynthesis (KDO)2-(lauroyl)-lipid IVA acyltransferase, partial [Salmonella enterica subsp. enterica serovar Typhimurium]